MTEDMQNASEEIRFTFGKFSLGMVLVAATEKGIAAILLGDSRDELHRELVYAFPKAHLVADDAGLADKAAIIVAFLDAPNQGWTCRSTFVARRRSRPCGKRCAMSRLAKPSPMARSPNHCGCLPPPRMWVPHAPPMCWPSPFPATGWSRPMVRFQATAGVFSASGN